MVSSPWLLVEGFKLGRPFYPLSGEPATPTFGHTTDARDGRRQGMTTIRFPDKKPKWMTRNIRSEHADAIKGSWMKTSSEHPKPKLYLLLLAIQIFGAIVFIWQQLPEFRQVAVNPGAQLPHDTFSDLVAVGVLCVMQISFWVRVRYIAIPFRHPNMILHHVFLFLGRLSFIFGSALFAVVVFRHLPELGRDIDIPLAARRGILLVACLFALFCASLEVERLGQAFEGDRN
jgi:hypothetical protein